MNLQQIIKITENNSRYKRQLVSISFAIIFALCICYWIYNRNFVSTDDGYVNANVIQISPQVTGRVIKLYVQNNQYVHQGQALFDIDPASYQVVVDRDQAQLELARLNVKQAEAAVAAAEADVTMKQADLHNAKVSADRIRALFKKHYASQQNDDDAQSKLKTSTAALALSQANLDAAKNKLGATGEDNEQVRQAKANLEQAKLNLSYTHVVAAADGNVTNMSLRVGDVVQTNHPLFALISDKEFWVDANFKETDLEHVRPGQSAKIAVDMYPGYLFKGVVNSVSGGSGSAFSLLPPENATGNWVKVTQRVPVKVVISNPDKNHPLLVGTTATVTIKIKV